LALVCLGPVSALAADSGADYPPAPAGQAGDATGDASLTTLFNQNNNFAGNSFDIEAATDLTVVGFDCNLSDVAGPPLYTVEVWWRVGTADGFETSPVGWNMLGSVQVVPQGINVPTHIDVGGMSMAPGQVNGMVIHALEAVSGTGGFHYTNGGPGTIFSNADMTITTWDGMGTGFPNLTGSTFTGRQWNGTVHYDYATTAVDAATWGSIKGVFQN
jgi:hypothetical protein